MIPNFKGLDKRRKTGNQEFISKPVQNGRTLNLSKTLVAKHEYPYPGDK